VNSTITPENLAAYNEVVVNDIYLDTWAREIYEFDSTWYATLSDIAQQNPISGGMAVYTARVMLGVDYDDNSPEEESRIAAGENSKDKFIHVYPNPAADEITVEYSLNDDEQGVIIISDMTGRELLKQTIAGGMNVIQISTSEIANGIYHLNLKVNDELIGNQKLVIVK